MRWQLSDDSFLSRSSRRHSGKTGLLYFLFEPGVSGALIAYDQAKTWVLMHDWNPELENREDYTDEKCLGLIERAVGQPLPQTTIENISPWVMTAQVAKAYRKGRVFLAGDSAPNTARRWPWSEYRCW